MKGRWNTMFCLISKQIRRKENQLRRNPARTVSIVHFSSHLTNLAIDFPRQRYKIMMDDQFINYILLRCTCPTLCDDDPTSLSQSFEEDTDKRMRREPMRK